MTSNVLDKTAEFTEDLTRGAEKFFNEEAKEAYKEAKKFGIFTKESFKFYNQKGLWWLWYVKFLSMFVGLWFLALYVLAWRFYQLQQIGFYFYTLSAVIMSIFTLGLMGYMGIDLPADPNDTKEKQLDKERVFQSYNGYLAFGFIIGWLIAFGSILFGTLVNGVAFTSTLNPISLGTFNYALVTDNATITWGFTYQPGLYPIYTWFMVFTILEAIAMLPILLIILGLIYIAYKANFWNTIRGLWDGTVGKIELLRMGKKAGSAEEKSLENAINSQGRRHVYSQHLEPGKIRTHKNMKKHLGIPDDHMKEITDRIERDLKRQKKMKKKGSTKSKSKSKRHEEQEEDEE